MITPGFTPQRADSFNPGQRNRVPMLGFDRLLSANCDPPPPAHGFTLSCAVEPVRPESKSWLGHPDAPNWLLKRSEGIFFHVPSSSLWRRRPSRDQGHDLVRIDTYSRAIAGFATQVMPILLRAALLAWFSNAKESRKWCTEELLAAEEEACPTLRIGSKGLRHGRRGVSPPPLTGWIEALQGWQKQVSSETWLRKLDESGGFAFFHVPTESLWTNLADGRFACVDTYHSALAAFVSSLGGTKLRLWFLAWQRQTQVVKYWRTRIRVMRPPADPQENADVSGGSTGLLSFPMRKNLKGLANNGSLDDAGKQACPVGHSEKTHLSPHSFKISARERGLSPNMATKICVSAGGCTPETRLHAEERRARTCTPPHDALIGVASHFRQLYEQRRRSPV